MMICKADLHIHTVLSPCGDLEMSPRNIVYKALEQGLNMIGITDHNTTLQCQTVLNIAQPLGLFVLCGAEVTSREDVHSLAFFESNELLNQFQKFLEQHQPKIPNKPQSFGYQVVVDEDDNILKEIKHYLGMGLELGIDEIEQKVHSLNGIFIPAHINRARYSLISQLGFVPSDIQADALEIFNKTNTLEFRTQHPELEQFSFVKNSDSHYLDSIGTAFTNFHVNSLNFSNIKQALKGENGQNVTIN